MGSRTTDKAGGALEGAVRPDPTEYKKSDIIGKGETMRKVIVFLTLVLIIVSLIGTCVPVKYLPMKELNIDLTKVNQVSIPGAQTIDFYDIHGSSEKALQDAMFKEQESLGGVARTTWSVSYIYVAVNPGTPECAIKNVKVPYTVKVTMPRWTDPENGTVILIWFWESYLKRLSAHEGHHVQILLDHIDDVQTAIESSSCETASKNAEAAIAEITRLQVEYDAVTDHGKKETLVLTLDEPAGKLRWAFLFPRFTDISI